MGAGVALGYKMDKVDGCVVIGHGDGTLNEGVISETLNMVATWKLPVVWVIENNGIAVSTKVEDSNAIIDLSERGRGFGLPSSSYDATDVLLVREVMREAMAKAKRGEPSLSEFRTVRWLGHFVGDPDLCRDGNIVTDARANRDSLIWFRNHLLAKKMATVEEMDAIDAASDKEIRDSLDFALKQPGKTPEDVFCSVNTEQY
jgi:pyruvate dehydrogenase E1 component alpha subunit